MRGDQLARQWRILRLIEESRNGLTVAEISRREEISLRTAYRDVEALEQAGFPLYCERLEGTKRWAFVDAYKFRLPQPFTLTELMSLHLYGDLTRVFKGTAFHDSLESLFKKVRATLPAQALAYLDRMQSAFSVGIRPFKEYGPFREIMNRVNQAVAESRRLEIAYHSLRREKETLRKIDPYKIWFLDGTLYLIGFCHLRGEVRMFVLDRIRMLNLTEEKFEYPLDFDLDRFMGDSFKVMRDEMFTVKVRISAAWSRWADEKIWHESQKSRRMEDGGLELTFRVAGLDEIKMWVLSLGQEAYVVEPEALREMVRAAHMNAAARYARKTEPARAGGESRERSRG